MKKYSISAQLPVNVIISANSKKEALKLAEKATDLPYEPAGDIKFKDKPNIVEIENPQS
jgi:hypothetical protein